VGEVPARVVRRVSRMQASALLAVAGLSVSARANGHDTSTDPHQRSVPISTSSWKPGDPGADALIRGTLRFTHDGCPTFGSKTGVVWPADYTSVVRPNGEQVVVTAEGRDIGAGDTVISGGGVGGAAPSGVPGIRPGATLTYLESEVQVIQGH
jgi:hypothetical protein